MTNKEKHIRYEIEKRELEKKQLPAQEYEKALQQLAKKLRL